MLLLLLLQMQLLALMLLLSNRSDDAGHIRICDAFAWSSPFQFRPSSSLRSTSPVSISLPRFSGTTFRTKVLHRDNKASEPHFSRDTMGISMASDDHDDFTDNGGSYIDENVEIDDNTSRISAVFNEVCVYHR